MSSDELARRRERMLAWKAKKAKAQTPKTSSSTRACSKPLINLSAASKRAGRRRPGAMLSAFGAAPTQPRPSTSGRSSTPTTHPLPTQHTSSSSSRPVLHRTRKRKPPSLLTSSLEASKPKAPPSPPAEQDPFDAFMEQVQAKARADASTGQSNPGEALYGDDDALEESDMPAAAAAAAAAAAGGAAEDDSTLTWTERQAKALLAKQKALMEAPVDHAAMEYAPFERDLYHEAQELAEMSVEDVQARRAELGVRIRGKKCPKPLSKWSHCGLPAPVMNAIRRAKFAAPFPIQAQAIPAVMSGRDVIACAKTGSGKTLAFVLPMIRHILVQPPLKLDEGPIAVILAPTRELVVQIYKEAKRFAQPAGIEVAAVYGGGSVSDQIARLKAGPQMVVASPGRYIDMLSRTRITNMRRCTIVAIDELDRCFDLGFEPQIMRILAHVRPDRQVIMFSATFPRSIESLARRVLKRPLEIIVGGRSAASTSVTQHVEVLEDDEEVKFRRLLAWLGKFNERGSILIFASTQEQVDAIFARLNAAGYSCLALHGGVDQSDRDCTMVDFKRGVCNVMVATSLVARGLDVKTLQLVVNFTPPSHYEDYVHRVGRTGRAGRTGTAVTFITPSEDRYAPDLVRALKNSEQEVPQALQDLADIFANKVTAGLEKHAKNYGFSGQGFKFDANEARQRAEQQHIDRVRYGIDEADEDYDAIIARRRMEAANRTTKRKRDATDSSSDDDTPDRPRRKRSKKPAEDSDSALLKRQVAAVRAAAKSASLHAKVGSSSSTDVVRDIISNSGLDKPVMSKGASKARALAARFAKRGSSKSDSTAATAAAAAAAAATAASTEPGAEPEEPSYVKMELEINDYPQNARWSVTHKGGLDDLLEPYDISITARGTFVPPGTRTPDGERKLYLLLEGKNEHDVEMCHRAILQKLEEVAAKAPTPEARPGKYSVL